MRNILVARLIAVEDYGIAATFALTMTLIEMTSNLAVDRLIVQAEEGDDPKLQGTAHVFEIGRGVLSALILFAIANPVALLFNLPNLVWAYQLLAVVPLVRGFIHLDSVRFQREMKFRPAMCIEVLPQLISFGAAWFIAQEFGDYRLMLALIIVQVVTTVIFSHLLSDRPYRWSWNGRFFKKIMKFGWPLMLNGVLLFGVFQADRAIVGAAIGMEQLGWFGAAFTLTLFPSMVAAKICQSFLLPLLSRNKADHKRFVDGSNATLEICLVVGAILAVATAVGGPAVLILLFGERYSEGASVIVWLGLMQGLRLVKAGPVIVAMSRGITTLPLLSNIARSLAIVMA
ncbi:MAG: oligosaccharide flippase family protein, partial [Lentilitoribacter sp.]